MSIKIIISYKPEFDKVIDNVKGNL